MQNRVYRLSKAHYFPFLIIYNYILIYSYIATELQIQATSKINLYAPMNAKILITLLFCLLDNDQS